MGQALTTCKDGCNIDTANTISEHFSNTDRPNEMINLVLRVDHAPINDMDGATVSGFTCGDKIVVHDLCEAPGLAALGWRYRDKVKAVWPNDQRFQAPRKTFLCNAVGRDDRDKLCVLQVDAFVPKGPKSMECAWQRVDDAANVAEHASRFNRQMAQSLGNVVNLGEQNDPVPTVKVCAPVACEVISTCYADILPSGAACTLTHFPFREVNKFVFDGADEFADVPQSFFHYVAFVTRMEEFVCDLQGHEDDDGNILLLDPVVLSMEKPNVTQLLSTLKGEPIRAGLDAKDGPLHGPTEGRFEALHPKCGQMCQSFDPSRRGVKGKKGFCGISCGRPW